jgi:hypothetical protein
LKKRGKAALFQWEAALHVFSRGLTKWPDAPRKAGARQSGKGSMCPIRVKRNA